MNSLQYYLSGMKQRMPRFDAFGGTRAAHWLGPRAAFLRELLHQPRTVGAVCPSSCELAWRMASWVDLAPAGWVIELGGGTGTVTAALLQRGVPRERLIVIEQSRHFVNHLHGRFPGVRILHADAADVAATTTLDGRPVAAIVSGLPLRSLPAEAVSRVVQACAGVLSPHSRVIQFTYAPRARSAWRDGGLHRMAHEAVWQNLPPAWIEVFTPASNPNLTATPARKT